MRKLHILCRILALRCYMPARCGWLAISLKQLQTYLNHYKSVSEAICGEQLIIWLVQNSAWHTQQYLRLILVNPPQIIIDSVTILMIYIFFSREHTNFWNGDIHNWDIWIDKWDVCTDKCNSGCLNLFCFLLFISITLFCIWFQLKSSTLDQSIPVALKWLNLVGMTDTMIGILL